jgi:hypothetical protein
MKGYLQKCSMIGGKFSPPAWEKVMLRNYVINTEKGKYFAQMKRCFNHLIKLYGNGRISELPDAKVR